MADHVGFGRDAIHGRRDITPMPGHRTERLRRWTAAELADRLRSGGASDTPATPPPSTRNRSGAGSAANHGSGAEQNGANSD